MSVQLHRVNEVTFERVEINPEIPDLLQQWWEQSTSEVERFFNGEVVGIHSLQVAPNKIKAYWFKTSYAHGLQRFAAEPVCSPALGLFCSTKMTTTDGFIVAGRMGPHTASAGYGLLPGGSVEPPEDVLTLDYCKREAVRELREEIGLDTEASSLQLWRVKTNGNIGLIFSVSLPYCSKQILQIYQEHCKNLRQKQEQPEFSDLLFLHKGIEDIKVAPYVKLVLNEVYEENL